MVTLFAAVLLGLTLGSYLYLVHAQNISVFRSQAWNGALAMAEAGVEEALAQLNQGGVPGPEGVNWSANGWGPPDGGTYGPISRSLGGGSYSVTFTTNAASPRPTIVSTGYVQVPAISATLSRVVQVTTTNAPLFAAAVVGKDRIDLNGWSFFSDSFDSSDPNYSDNGGYPSSYPARMRTQGNVASVAGLLHVGSATIHGSLLLGPTGAYSVGTNGSVGPVSYDFNVDFPDVVLPATTWWSPPGPDTINGFHYDHVFLHSGDFKVRDFDKIYVGTNVNVRIWLYDSRFRMSGSDAVIRIAPVGASLKIYMTSASFSMEGQGVVNESGYTTNFYYFGLPGNTNVSWGSNSNFVGAIYAPQAALWLGSGGSDHADFIGACLAKSVTLNGQFRFHFDEDLARQGPARGYLATSWKEL